MCALKQDVPAVNFSCAWLTSAPPYVYTIVPSIHKMHKCTSYNVVATDLVLTKHNRPASPICKLLTVGRVETSWYLPPPTAVALAKSAMSPEMNLTPCREGMAELSNTVCRNGVIGKSTLYKLG